MSRIISQKDIPDIEIKSVEQVHSWQPIAPNYQCGDIVCYQEHPRLITGRYWSKWSDEQGEWLYHLQKGREYIRGGEEFKAIPESELTLVLASPH